MNQFAERHIVTQMHRDQVTSATITIDDGGGVLRGHDSALPRMVPRWRRFWWILISRRQLVSRSDL